jgi:hypothetical protein
MEFIEGTSLSKKCDYSFGDQSGCIGNVPGSFMKQANLSNIEFSKLVEGKEWMTIFIDNIRLYKRPIKCTNDSDQRWVDSLLETNNMLETCAAFPETKFIIFTNLEDTPINEDIHSLIPENVKAIYGVNAIGFGGKVHPFPYGVQRIIHSSDNRISILRDAILEDVSPKKLLYINHAEHTNISERGNIREKFANLNYATVDNRVSYDIYCSQIQNHKFMICPQGNGIDCHRNWEVLYLKRVPIMKKIPYLQELYKEYPVLWVDDYSEVTKTLLTNNENLYDQSRNFDNNMLDLYSMFNRLVKRAKNS